jgi:2-dehydropantoate 2-reductase
VCLQNGAENERVALRRFADVYGAVVMAPTAHVEPGVVQAYGSALTGVIDIGRYSSGVDERCRRVFGALSESRFSSEPRPEIMRHKYAKLIANLANVVQAVCGPDDEAADKLAELAREEGRGVLRAAGIAFDVPEVADVGGRWERWEWGRSTVRDGRRDRRGRASCGARAASKPIS